MPNRTGILSYPAPPDVLRCLRVSFARSNCTKNGKAESTLAIVYRSLKMHFLKVLVAFSIVLGEKILLALLDAGEIWFSLMFASSGEWS